MVVYLGDILFFSQSWEEHLHHIRQVLQTMCQHNLSSNIEKRTFGMTQVQYLGYIIDEKGVHVDPTKIQFVQDCPTPTTLSKLCNVTGLANFYHRFVLGFSHINWPLIKVTKGRAKRIPNNSPSRHVLFTRCTTKDIRTTHISEMRNQG